MSLIIGPADTYIPKKWTYETLLERAERGQLDWQSLLKEENRLAKCFGQERFDELLEIATAGKVNFI